MGYDNMDHVDWVQRDIAAGKRMLGKTKPDKRNRGYAAAPDTLNPFHQRVFTILGIIGGGIYNAPIVWESVEWAPRWIALNWQHRELATIDGDALTVAVLLCHDAAVRMSVQPNMRVLRLIFHERRPRVAGTHWHNDHPTLEQALQRHRERFPASHHVHFASAEPVS